MSNEYKHILAIILFFSAFVFSLFGVIYLIDFIYTETPFLIIGLISVFIYIVIELLSFYNDCCDKIDCNQIDC
jgi:uncharacterized membrane protein YkvI